MRVDSFCNAISLFSGYEGIGLGLGAVVRGLRVVAYVEREVYAVQVLVERMAGGQIEPAPICTDVREFDGRWFSGKVDGIFGGFPCQDISVAGRGEGIRKGNRSGLWFEFARVIREVGPRWVFVENVGALVGRGLEIVLGDLAQMGFDAEWGVFSAAEAGAPHRRDRLFILAYKHRDRRESQWLGRDERQIEHEASFGNDADRRGGAAELEHDSSERRAFPPGPAEREAWRHIPEDLQPATQPALRGVVDGAARGVGRVKTSRVDELRILGNGVVPAVAAVAWVMLMKQMKAEVETP